MGIRNSWHRGALRLALLGCVVALACSDPVSNNRVQSLAQAVPSAPLAVDAFQRPDELPIAGNWTSGPSAFNDLRLASGAVIGVSEGLDGVAYYRTVSWPADQWAELRLTGLGSGADGGVAVRVSATAAQAYGFVAGGSGTWYGVGKFINGTWFGFIRADLTWSVGDVMRLEVLGDTLRAFRNGVLVFQTRDSDITAGSAGIFVYSNDPGLRFDDFAGGTFTADSTPPPPPPTPPAAPTALSASAASSSRIDLAWTDNAGDETGFRIERCTGVGCGTFTEIAQVGANVTSYQNSGLAAATSFSYRVRAYNAAGASAYTNVASATTGTSSVTDRLPDLGIAQLTDIRISTSGGRRRLRYSTTIVNVGVGPFEVHGHRSSTSDTEMSVVQRVYDDAGGSRDIPTAAVTVYSGDGHDHWHVRDLQLSELYRISDGQFLARSNKRGFCFWDNVRHQLSLPGAPANPIYSESGCGDPGSLSTNMGLSIGWGDIYPSTLPDQYIDVTRLTDGFYRLIVTADASGWFLETNDGNNSTYVDIELYDKVRRVRVVGYGPSAVMAMRQSDQP